MISIIIFTYKRINKLNNCLNSLDSSFINEILIFNDDEKNRLSQDMLKINPKYNKLIRIYNPLDFGFKNRAFRKPFYINKSVKISNSNFILFSDDDGIFDKGAIDKHIKGLKHNVFCAGAIKRGYLFKRKSKSILQGTNYSFQKTFFNQIEGYDEAFIKSEGSGDIDFWYRIYNKIKKTNYSVAYLSNATQTVSTKSQRKKNNPIMDPREYTINKHNLQIQGPMYKWFPNIRNKHNWMNIIND